MGLFSSRPANPNVSVVALPSQTTAAATGTLSTIATVLGGVILLYLAYRFFNYIQKRNGLPGLTFFETKSSGDKTPSIVDGKVRTVIPAGEVSVGAGSDYGLQFWMYITNWDYKFGADKEVLKRVAPNNPAIMGPRIFLAPNENTLHVQLSLYPSDTQAGAANPNSNSTGDSFKCSVENVPLQSWFSVSMTVFQRNLDIYINGRLVKSCILPGVPKPALGDIILNDNGGFGGSSCNLNGYASMLSPDDARSFHAKGTSCSPPGDATKEVDKDSIFVTLFGYTFRFSTLSKEGKELNSYTL
jgi:hypothetical protein